jgi:hypothetical protein
MITTFTKLDVSLDEMLFGLVGAAMLATYFAVVL